MFTLAQPACHFYNPYEELAMQQELQLRRQMEAYLRRQREADEMERCRREYEAAVRAEYERRRQVELERQRQAELQRRRQAQQDRGRHSMYDGGLESLFDALYGRQGRSWEDHQTSTPVRNTSPPARSPTPASVPVSTSVPAPTPTEPEAALEPQMEESQVDTAPSHAAVQSILSSLATLQSEFTFPAQLDFLPGSSKLAYTPNNAPLHGYEHALTGLLTRLDAVESYGDEGVRRARKEAVKTIEKELERLDKMKAEAWKRGGEAEAEMSESAEVSVETSVDPVSVPLPEDCDADDKEMEGVLEATVSEELPMADLPSTSVPVDSDPTEPTTLPDEEYVTPSERSSDANPTPISTAPITSELAPPKDEALETPLPRTPGAEPLSRALRSPSPFETSESDSKPDPELEEYVGVQAMSMSEDEGGEMDEVEKEGDLELMRDWDFDF
ncbi:unnamed protein product [Rhizoctonia solani]|uniref:BAG domain-containing protein n=1 Tax=Rhizoctonia solani TaxID=456999 RepID=A0A8H3D8L6_9AGAM|nr:unnamed protein product [Rhizoctonia solani]